MPLQLELRGGNDEVWDAREREVLVEGPRGTGKTRAILELVNALCHSFPGLSVLIVRKYQKTLATTCLKTLNEQVLHNGDGVSYFGGSDREPACYRYPGGSRIVIGGMDNSEKVKSSEYDLIYANEATELNEEDWEALLPLLRHQVGGKRLIEAQRIIADCNPSHAGHWLNRRCESGKTRRIKTTLKDNPSYFDAEGNPTPAGEAYMATLTSLTGSRRERWLEGKWTGVEDAIYPIFDRLTHVRPLEPNLQLRTYIGVDYGSSHLCAVAAVSLDQFRRRWVREVWAEVDNDQGASLSRIIGQFKERYQATRGRVDPNQGFLAGRSGFNVARGGSGGAGGAPRLHRIDLMEPLFYTFAGGRVPRISDELSASIERGPFAEPDSPGILLVEGAPGIEALGDEIDGYHYVWTETEKGKTKDVYRVGDDRIAAVEYANEEIEEGSSYDGVPTVAVIDEEQNAMSRYRRRGRSQDGWANV